MFQRALCCSSGLHEVPSAQGGAQRDSGQMAFCTEGPVSGIYLCTYVSIYLPIYLSIYLVISIVYRATYLSICLSICLPIYQSIRGLSNFACVQLSGLQSGVSRNQSRNPKPPKPIRPQSHINILHMKTGIAR